MPRLTIKSNLAQAWHTRRDSAAYATHWRLCPSWAILPRLCRSLRSPHNARAAFSGGTLANRNRIESWILPEPDPAIKFLSRAGTAVTDCSWQILLAGAAEFARGTLKR
jgi:hypothetical protein